MLKRLQVLSPANIAHLFCRNAAAQSPVFFYLIHCPATLQNAHKHLSEHQVADASVFAPLMTTGEELSFELFQGSLKINESPHYFFSNPSEMSQFLIIH